MKYSNLPKNVDEAMNNVMKSAKLSKTQGQDLLKNVEQLEQAKLDANCKVLSEMFGSEEKVLSELQTFAPIIRDKFGNSGTKALELIKHTQYDPHLVNCVLMAAKAFKSDKHISREPNMSANKDSIEQEIRKKWVDPAFKQRYQQGDERAIKELDLLYNKLYI